MIFLTAAESIGFVLYDVHTIGTVSLHQVLEAERAMHELINTYWYQTSFLTPKWWFLVILSIVPAIIWWFVVDKKRITEVTAFGLFYGVAATILDSIGSNMMLWTYRIRLTPFMDPQFYPYDVGIVIIPFMLVFQRWGKNFKKFALYSLLLSFMLAFVAEPVMEWLKIYKQIIWRNIYSFPIYWLLSLICWGIIRHFKSLEQR
ncbi:CBO0543 family protein [Neobacillus sp. PS3-34]|uniref:CBO0543 family protein n=1 Tax=Neobacillus sp. PS3-34 TaxID=3070678 RepID=UPI0027E06867|nr:CBO0543 family protein [Neobacillus sp. PS3-34]WML50080.1 CBO0543 family protein [Neobacillus sp. PS3-34]